MSCIFLQYFLSYSTILETYRDILDLIIHNFLKNTPLPIQSKSRNWPNICWLHTTTFAILITKWSLLEFFFSTNEIFFSLWKDSDYLDFCDKCSNFFKQHGVDYVWAHIFLAGLKKDCIWNCMVMQIYFKIMHFIILFGWSSVQKLNILNIVCTLYLKTTTYYLLAP